MHWHDDATRRTRHVNRRRGLAAAVTAVVAIGLMACTQKPEYAVTLDAPPEVTHKLSAGALTIPVKITNGSRQTFSVNTKDYLAYHVLSPEGKMLVGDGIRTGFADLGRGDTVEVPMKVELPKAPGEYVLAADLVREGITWFASQPGNHAAQIKLHLQP